MVLPSFSTTLKSLDSYPVLGTSIPQSKYIPLDLSINNTKLKIIDTSSSEVLKLHIWSLLRQNNAKVAFGGYLEQRDIYRRSTHFNSDERNIHLGIDLWIEADTPIYAPLDAKIHSFKNNTNHGDYGPTIILEHNLEQYRFFTLYGHLSLESLESLTIGAKISKGQQIGTLGTALVNGDYAPHLHFQIIRDIQSKHGDYPGVCSKPEVAFYSLNCPNPNLILQLI